MFQGNHSKNPQKVFLDANIFISAVLSDRGGSFRILQEAQLSNIAIFTSSYVMQEVRRVLVQKYPSKLDYVYAFLSQVPISFIKDPTVRQVASFAPLIEDVKDIPILAATKKAKVQFLITLDCKHFFTAKLKNSRLPFKIVTPKDFFQKHYR